MATNSANKTHDNTPRRGIETCLNGATFVFDKTNILQVPLDNMHYFHMHFYFCQKTHAVQNFENENY